MQHVIDVFLMNPVGQTFGILGMIAFIIGFLQKDDKKIVQILIVSNVFWVFHFFLMEIYSGMFMAIIGALRMILTIKYRKNIKIFQGVLVVTLLLGIVSYESVSSILPILASLLATYAFFFLDRIKFRLALLVCSSFWFNYHYIHFSIGGIINESLLQIVHIFMIYRLMVEQGGTRKYIFELKELFLHRAKIDYGRYQSLVEFIRWKKKK